MQNVEKEKLCRSFKNCGTRSDGLTHAQGKIQKREKAGCEEITTENYSKSMD